MSSDTLAIHQPPLVLSVQRSPSDVLYEAREAARALKGVIDAKPEDKKVKFGDEVYLEFEDWETVGRFYGIAPHITWTRPLDLGDGIKGWEARAEAVHVESGRVVASAEAMCLNDEEKWRARPKYEYAYVKKSGGTSVEDPGRDQIVWEDNPRKPGSKRPKKVRALVGEEVVPSFQLRSMAQTRAGAKALRNALAWVVVLAGYKPTPAEEMPDHGGPPRGLVLDIEDLHQAEPTATGTNSPEFGSGESASGGVGRTDAPTDEAAGLFPKPEDEERQRLATDAQRLAGKLKLKEEQKDTYRKTYLNGSDLLDPNLDIAALTDLVNALRARAGEKKWGA